MDYYGFHDVLMPLVLSLFYVFPSLIFVQFMLYCVAGACLKKTSISKFKCCRIGCHYWVGFLNILVILPVVFNIVMLAKFCRDPANSNTRKVQCSYNNPDVLKYSLRIEHYEEWENKTGNTVNPSLIFNFKNWRDEMASLKNK